ncbi:MAG: hypothetical protein ACPGUU_01805, partial [Flavobacteriaceae bacterium]
TDKEYDAILYIGGIINRNFIATDSVKLKDIKKGGVKQVGKDIYNIYFTNENRWRPNLDKIRAIPSERCYFKIKLSDGREKVILNTSSEFFGLDISDGKKEFVNEKGRIYMYIYDDDIFAKAAKE